MSRAAEKQVLFLRGFACPKIKDLLKFDFLFEVWTPAHRTKILTHVEHPLHVTYVGVWKCPDLYSYSLDSFPNSRGNERQDKGVHSLGVALNDKPVEFVSKIAKKNAPDREMM